MFIRRQGKKHAAWHWVSPSPRESPSCIPLGWGSLSMSSQGTEYRQSPDILQQPPLGSQDTDSLQRNTTHNTLLQVTLRACFPLHMPTDRVPSPHISTAGGQNKPGTHPPQPISWPGHQGNSSRDGAVRSKALQPTEPALGGLDGKAAPRHGWQGVQGGCCHSPSSPCPGLTSQTTWLPSCLIKCKLLSTLSSKTCQAQGRGH